MSETMSWQGPSTRRLALLIYTCVLLSACSSASGSIEVEHAWAPPTPPNASVGAVYLELTARQSDRLLSASSPAAARVEVHQTTVDSGVSKMRRVDSLVLKEHERVELAPGGIHFMLVELAAPLQVGQHFPLELRFESAGTLTVEVEVMAADADHAHH